MAGEDSERLRQLKSSLTNHTPSADGLRRIDKVREAAKTLGAEIIAASGNSRERSIALTHLEETTMWSVKAIVLEGAADA